MTIVMKLTAPNAPFLANMAMDFYATTSSFGQYADYLMKKGTPEQFDQLLVGTGPFTFVDYQKDVIRFKANRGKPKIDDLVYAITTDPMVRYVKIKANEIPGDDRANPILKR